LKEEARLEGRLGTHGNFSRICKDTRKEKEIKERGRKIVETFGRDLESIFKQHSELLVLSQNQFKIFGNMKGLVFIQNKTRWGRFNKTIQAKNNRVLFQIILYLTKTCKVTMHDDAQK
jgi:hypothetical protein